MRAPPTATLAARAVRDPGIVTLILVGAAAVVLCLSPVGGVPAQVIGFWLSETVLDLLLFLVCWDLIRSHPLPAPVFRFWRALRRSGLLFLVGDAAQAVIAIHRRDVSAAVPGTAQTVFSILAMGIFILSMLTYPLVAASRRARARFWLDAATVLIAATVFVWITTVTPSVIGQGTEMLLGTLFANGLLIVAAFAGAKLTLTANAPLTRVTALPMVASALLQGLLTPLAPGSLDARHFSLLLAARVLPAVLVVVGVRLHELQLRSDPEAILHRTRRRFSTLPYVMIAATYVMLFVVLGSGLSLQSVGALVGVVMTSAIVVTRQLMAFNDNVGLLEQLDRSMSDLSRQEKRFRSLVQHASDIIMVTDAAGALSYLSPSVQHSLGQSPEDLYGRSLLELTHPDDRAGVAETLAAVRVADQATVTYQCRYQHADGAWRWFDVISTNLLGEPSVAGIVSNAREVTETRSLHEKLRHQASHDALTGLPNRSLFAERMTALAQAGGTDSVAVLMVDLDGFKQINDTLGHHAGDAVLVAVAQRLTASIRTVDTAARLGGDEFAMLLPGCGSAAAAKVAERFLSSLESPIEADGQMLRIQASVGITADRPDHPDALLRVADAAMYAAKRGGKNQYVCAVPDSG